MDRAYAEPLDVRAVAAVAHISPAHFSRCFRAVFGESPHRYLQRRRVERSMFLLRESDRTVTDICFDVGFSSHPVRLTRDHLPSRRHPQRCHHLGPTIVRHAQAQVAIHTEETDAVTVIDNAIYVDGRRVASPDSLDATSKALEAHGGFAWIGLYRPDIDELQTVADEFQLHELAVEDALNGHQRAKLDRYGDRPFARVRPRAVALGDGRRRGGGGAPVPRPELRHRHPPRRGARHREGASPARSG